MQKTIWALAATALCLMTACASTTEPQLVTKVDAPAATMLACQPPVLHIKTFGDAYSAAVMNGERLRECSIRHNGLIKFEESRTE